ncbi:hypothetical protein CPAV1605_1558 [seawater metagenome]|uniref:Uncharacterized protein n=1 Tax=seawater metagenome TaxID=1561972 RepID=A0A5E8CME3_9ZZZZ
MAAKIIESLDEEKELDLIEYHDDYKDPIIKDKSNFKLVIITLSLPDEKIDSEDFEYPYIEFLPKVEFKGDPKVDKSSNLHLYEGRIAQIVTLHNFNDDDFLNYTISTNLLSIMKYLDCKCRILCKLKLPSTIIEKIMIFDAYNTFHLHSKHYLSDKIRCNKCGKIMAPMNNIKNIVQKKIFNFACELIKEETFCNYCWKPEKYGEKDYEESLISYDDCLTNDPSEIEYYSDILVGQMTPFLKYYPIIHGLIKIFLGTCDTIKPKTYLL